MLLNKDEENELVRSGGLRWFLCVPLFPHASFGYASASLFSPTIWAPSLQHSLGEGKALHQSLLTLILAKQGLRNIVLQSRGMDRGKDFFAHQKSSSHGAVSLSPLFIPLSFPP